MECPPVGWVCPQHPQLPLRLPSVALRRRREPTSGASATAGCHGLLRWLRSCECGRGKNSTESHYSGKASGKASIEISSAKAFTQCEGVPSASRTSSHAQPHPMIPFGAVRPFSASCDAQHSAPIKSVLISRFALSSPAKKNVSEECVAYSKFRTLRCCECQYSRGRIAQVSESPGAGLLPEPPATHTRTAHTARFRKPCTWQTISPKLFKCCPVLHLRCVFPSRI